jgi:hypothetical protein
MSLLREMTRLTYRGKEYLLRDGEQLSLAGFTFTPQSYCRQEAVVLVEVELSHELAYPRSEVCSYLGEEISRLRRKFPVTEKDALDLMNDLKNYQNDLEEFQRSSLPAFSVKAHTFLTIVDGQAYHFTSTHGNMQFSLDMGPTQNKVAVPLELQVTDHKTFFIRCIAIFKQYALVAISSMGLLDSCMLKADSAHHWQVVSMTPRDEFMASFLYVYVDGEETQQLPVIYSGMQCLELDIKQSLNIRWAGNQFELSMEDEGAIPRLADAKRKVCRLGTKACKSREDQCTLERLIQSVQEQPSTAETRSKFRALTEALRRERERGDRYLSSFQAVPSADGKIVSSWPMTWDRPVRIKRWVCSNGKVVNLTVTMVIKDLADKFDAITLQVSSIPFAEVTRVFVPDDQELDASGESFVEVVQGGSPVFSPTSPAPYRAADFSPSLLPGEAAYDDILAMVPLSLETEGTVENIPALSLQSVDPEPQSRSKSSKSPKHLKKARSSPY